MLKSFNLLSVINLGGIKLLRSNFPSLIKLNKNAVGHYKKPQILSLRDQNVNLLRETLIENKPVCSNKWKILRDEIIKTDRQINEINIDATIMGFCLSNVQLNVAKSYISYLKSVNIEPNIATLGRLLKLYHISSLKNELTIDDERDIISICKNLVEKNSSLDPSTSEHIIHALCSTTEWKGCLEFFENIKLTSCPSASTYSVIISKAFASNDIDLGWKLLQEMVGLQKQPKCEIFLSWIHNVCNKGKGGMIGIEKMLQFIGNNEIIVTKTVATEIKNFYKFNEQKCNFAIIDKRGTCYNCRDSLNKIKILDEEFYQLSSSFLEKVLIRENVFIKSTPEEIIKFEKFISNTIPYDIVIDGLNVAFSNGTNKPNIVYAKLLSAVVKYFTDRNKKILVLGRKHMNSWPKQQMSYVRRNSFLFLAENLSQDDPFLLYAALKSGPQTDFFSRDLMRSHAHLLGSELKQLFRRWQQEHQYTLLYAMDDGKMFIKPPTTFCTYAHKTGKIWHIPYTEEFSANKSDTFDIPSSWLCTS